MRETVGRVMGKESSNNQTPKEATGRRKNSNNQERRNSVSEITEYFNKADKLGKDNTTNMSMSTRTRKSSKNRDKSHNVDLNNDKSTKKAQEVDNNSKELTESDTETFDHDKEELSVQGPNAIKDQATLNDATTQTSEDAILTAVEELLNRITKLEDTINQPKNGIAEQLAKTTQKATDLYSDIHGAVSGLLVRMDQVTKTADSNALKIKQLEDSQQRIMSILNDNKKLMNELKTMQGLVHKVSQHSQITSNQVLDLTKRGMEQNIILHGVDDRIEIQDAKAETPMFSAKERCKQSVITFCKDIMNVNIEPEDIWKAHRTGPYKEGKVRPLVIKVSYAAKDLILEHMSSLKGKKNGKTEQVYFISEQIPDGITIPRKQVAARAKNLKDINDKKPIGEKQKIQVFNDKILIDGELSLPEITTPQPSDLFCSPEHQQKIDMIQSNMQETEPYKIKNSEFIGLATKVHSLEEMKNAYIAAVQRYPSADHVMAAYAFKDRTSSDRQTHLHHGSCDDREYGASIKIKNVLFEQRAKNTAIFVVRKYGGVHLGIDRFRSIQTVALQALDLLDN